MVQMQEYSRGLNMVCPPMISNNHMYELGNTMEKDGLPRYTPVDENGAHCPRRRRHIRRSIFRLAILTCLTYTLYIHWTWERIYGRPDVKETLTTDKLRTDYETCGRLRTVPKISKSARERNARYVDGHSAVLIRNATTWTGEPIHKSDDGYSWVQADVLMEYGLIKRVEPGISESELPSDCEIYEANGRQLTSGIVDMHSHVTVDPLPSLRGWSDDNELSSDITPYVRSLDGINPLDHQLQVIKSGGVTTSLILPGSGNNMGGEAYVVKHAVGKSDGRSEISAEDMLVDPDKTWRYMKMVRILMGKRLPLSQTWLTLLTFCIRHAGRIQNRSMVGWDEISGPSRGWVKLGTSDTLSSKRQLLSAPKTTGVMQLTRSEWRTCRHTSRKTCSGKAWVRS